MSRQALSPKRKAIDTECGSERRKTSEQPQQLTLAVREPSFIIKLKNEYVEPEHEVLVRLTLSKGFSYPSPPERLPNPPLPESPPHPSLLQLMPPSSSSTRSLQLPSESLSHLSFSQLFSQHPSPPGFPALPSSQSLPQNGILTVQPPALPAFHKSLFMPSYSSQYIKPPPGFVYQPELLQQSPPSEPKKKPPAEQKQEPPAEQKQEPPAEQKAKLLADVHITKRSQDGRQP